MKNFISLLALVTTIHVCISEDSKPLFLNQIDTLKQVITPTNTLNTGDLRGLINSLNAYARTALAGVRLAPPLSDIFNATKDIYKNLYESDANHTGANTFLQALIYSIVIGNIDEYLLPLFALKNDTDSLNILEKVKEEKTGY